MWIVDILKSNRYYERKLNEKKHNTKINNNTNNYFFVWLVRN